MNEIEKWGNDLVRSIKDTLNEYSDRQTEMNKFFYGRLSERDQALFNDRLKEFDDNYRLNRKKKEREAIKKALDAIRALGTKEEVNSVGESLKVTNEITYTGKDPFILDGDLPQIWQEDA